MFLVWVDLLLFAAATLEDCCLLAAATLEDCCVCCSLLFLLLECECFAAALVYLPLKYWLVSVASCLLWVWPFLLCCGVTWCNSFLLWSGWVVWPLSAVGVIVVAAFFCCGVTVDTASLLCVWLVGTASSPLQLCGLTVEQTFLITVVRVERGATSPCDCCVSWLIQPLSKWQLGFYCGCLFLHVLLWGFVLCQDCDLLAFLCKGFIHNFYV